LFYGIAGIGYTRTTTSDGQTTSKWTYSNIPIIIGSGNTIFAEVANSKRKTI